MDFFKHVCPPYPENYPLHHAFVDLVGAGIIALMLGSLPAAPLILISSFTEDRPAAWPLLVFSGLFFFPVYWSIRRQQ